MQLKLLNIDDVMLIGYRSSLDAAHEYRLGVVHLPATISTSWVIPVLWQERGVFTGWMEAKRCVKGMRLSDWIL